MSNGIDLKDLTKRIDSINTRAGNLRQSIQEALVLASLFCFQSGDTSYLNRLVKAAGQGSNQKSLIEYLEFHLPLKVKNSPASNQDAFFIGKKHKTFALLAEVNGVPRNEDHFRIDELSKDGNAWYQFKRPAKASTPKTADKIIAEAMKRLAKLAQDDAGALKMHKTLAFALDADKRKQTLAAMVEAGASEELARTLAA